MRGVKVLFGLLPWMAGMALLAASSLTLAAQFKADMVETHRGKTKTNQFYLRDDHYRLDVEEDGQMLNILVDRKAGKTRIVVPSQKVYLEIDNSDMQSLTNNPFEAYRYMADKYQMRSEGSETINGLACDKQVITLQDKDVQTAWVATKYDFPVKLENKMNGHLMELKNIKEGSVSPALLQVPSGYRLVAGMPIAPPDWAADIASAPVAKPPFEKTLSEGQILRIKPVRDFDVDLIVESLSGTQGSFSSNAFKDGRPLKRVTGYAGGGHKVHKESPDEADEIVVRAKSGQIRVKAELKEAPEGIMLKTYEMNANSGRQFTIDHRKAARLIVRDRAADGKDSRGTMIVYTTIERDMGKGATAYDQKEVHREKLQMANGESKTWQFDRSRQIGSVDITMLAGAVQARVEQPEQPGTIPPSWSKAPVSPFVAAGPQKNVASPAATVPAAAVQAEAASKPPRTSAANTTNAARMVLVLDASGSMWGQIDGKAKIDIAKDVMADLIAKIPGNVQTGLMVYGHRRKGDCSDIEMVTPLGAQNSSAMLAQVKAISPKGKTPLSAAVKQAAQALRYTEERATVVLVSDGLETCDIDPCELAAELAMSGVDFTVHVIGFDLSQEDQGRLRCLADKTGGLFLAADSAESLRSALFATVEKVEEAPAPVVEDPGTATLSAPATVPVGSEFKVQWEGPDSQRDYIAIAEKGSKDLRYKDYVYTQKGNPVGFTAPGDAGDYELRYVHAHSRRVIGRADIRVTPVQAGVRAPASADVATEFEVAWNGPAYKSDYIAVARSDQTPGSYVNYTYTSKGSPLKVRAPSDPGTYEVRYILGRGSRLLAKTSIDIKAVGASVQAPASADVATEFEVTWNGPANKEDYISVARTDQTPGTYVNYTYTREGSPLKVRAPSDPGTYEVRYILGRGSRLLAKTSIDIKAVGASVQAPASADVATEFEVTWNGPANKEDYISVARTDQSPGTYVNYTYTREGNPLKVRAPSDPGTYEVRYILGRGSRLLAKTSIDIKAVGASVQAPASADVATEFEVTWNGPANKEDYISVARTDQSPGSYVNYTYTREGSPLKVRAPSDPGTYEVRYILGRGRRLLAKTSIEIKAVSASVQAPASADMATEFEVAWNGPANKEDYISVARTDQSPGSYVNYTYTREGNPLKVRAPSDPGTYEVRYILGRGRRLLAKTSIEIKAVSATVKAPKTANVNSEVAVQWEGPGNKDDYICISRPGENASRYVTYQYVRKGNPCKLKTPKETGPYEVRYILGRGKKILAKATITIK